MYNDQYCASINLFINLAAGYSALCIIQHGPQQSILPPPNQRNRCWAEGEVGAGSRFGECKQYIYYIYSIHWEFLRFFSFDRIYRLFFFEFSIFSFKEFLAIMALAELELLLDFTSQDSRVVLDPNKLAESALLRSRREEVLLECVSSPLSLKSPKNLTISSSTSLQQASFLSWSMANSLRKYLTLISLLRPRCLGSNLNLMPFWVRQLARLSISNSSSQMMSSPMSRIQRSMVRGAYSQQKWYLLSGVRSEWWRLMRNSLSSPWRKEDMRLRISSSRSEWNTSFLCTSTTSSSPTVSFSCPNGYSSSSISTTRTPCYQPFTPCIINYYYYYTQPPQWNNQVTTHSLLTALPEVTHKNNKMHNHHHRSLLSLRLSIVSYAPCFLLEQILSSSLLGGTFTTLDVPLYLLAVSEYLVSSLTIWSMLRSLTDSSTALLSLSFYSSFNSLELLCLSSSSEASFLSSSCSFSIIMLIFSYSLHSAILKLSLTLSNSSLISAKAVLYLL